MKRAAALILVVVASACIPEEGPMMTPFQDCLGCHSAGGEKPWTVAGTWRNKSARVTITDSNRKSFTLKANQAGNFYTAEGLAFPITVSVDGKEMPPLVLPGGQQQQLNYGGCNACHLADGSIVNAFGPEMMPGTDCLRCHGPSGPATTKFSAAGSFRPAGQQVRVGNQTATTNAVGNFYITAPISFPANPTTVGGSSMEDGAPHGSCNAAGCHANFQQPND